MTTSNVFGLGNYFDAVFFGHFLFGFIIADIYFRGLFKQHLMLPNDVMLSCVVSGWACILA